MLKEKFINGLNDVDMMTYSIREPVIIEMTNEIASEQVLSWDKKVELQTVKKSNSEHN